MTLIHTALLSEAQYLIEYLKLTLVQKNPKIYKNNTIVLVVSGIGKENTLKSLEIVFKSYDISKAINIGIAGCNNFFINIGELFCTNQELIDINYLNLITVDTPVSSCNSKSTVLYDMEGRYFKEYALKYTKDIYIFKVVSDHLEDTIPSKEFVKQLIKKNIKSISQWV